MSQIVDRRRIANLPAARRRAPQSLFLLPSSQAVAHGALNLGEEPEVAATKASQRLA